MTEDRELTSPELGTFGHRQNGACLASSAGTAVLYSCDLQVTQTHIQITQHPTWCTSISQVGVKGNCVTSTLTTMTMIIPKMLIIAQIDIVIIIVITGGLSQQTAGAWHQVHIQCDV